MVKDRLLARVKELTELGQTALRTRRQLEYEDKVDSPPYREFRTAGLSFLRATFETGHPHYAEFDSAVSAGYSSTNSLQTGMAILEVVRAEIAGDWLQTFASLVSSEIFSDFLEMADYLLEEGYKDAAAVIIGGSLEAHLRRLAMLHKISLTFTNNKGDTKNKKADTLNADLVIAHAYDSTQGKAITSYQAIRNDAAHADYQKYDRDQVRNMRDGVLSFIAKFPA